MEECSIKFLFDNALSVLKTSNSPEYVQYVEALEKNGLSRKRMIDNYNDVKEDIRKKCENRTNRMLLDRHKCTASFMIAILNYLAVEENELNKEYFAISIGLSIIKAAIIEESNITKNCKLINHLDDKGFSFPNCIRDDEPYLRTWALGIHYGRLSGKLSVLSLANSLYWIERFNRDLVGE